MKKILLMAAVLLSSVGAFAQHAVGSISLQPKVGVSIADITSDDNDTRVGVVTGAELEYQANDWLGISAGALYSMQGCKYKEAGATITNKYDYINVPILANFYVTKGLALKAGIQPGFNVNSETKVSRGDKALSGDNDDVKSVDFSIPVGISYEYANFVLDARYNIGVTDVWKNYNGKNSVFQVTLGYKFDL